MNNDFPFTIRPCTDKSLPAFDHTKVMNIATCPRWGIIRYELGLTPNSGNSRAMALEAGKVAHEFYAAHRLTMLHKAGLINHFDYHGKRIFGADRFEAMRGSELFAGNANEGYQAFCLEALYTAEYVDDPMDARRTLSNIEAACLAYYNSWRGIDLPVWVADPLDATAPVGIELPFDVDVRLGDTGRGVRFVGRIDGIHRSKMGLVPIENKTSARLNDSWRMSFHTNHQVTGYNVGAACLVAPYGQTISHEGWIIGMQIPLPKYYEQGIAWQSYNRHRDQYKQWHAWLQEGVERAFVYHASPLDAPMYTHSCSRFFRTCSLLPLCASSREEQEQMLQEMNHEPWSPLDDET